MSVPTNPHIGNLDQNQIMQRAFDESTDRLRTDASLTMSSAEVAVIVSQEDDSIKIGDGVNLVTTTQEAGKSALDVHVTNPVINVNGLVPFQFDSIFPSYPTSTQEIYLYKNLGSTVATITVNYVDPTKNELVSIVRT